MDLSPPTPPMQHPHLIPSTAHILLPPKARWHSANLAVSLTSQLQTSGTQVPRRAPNRRSGYFFFKYIFHSLLSAKDFFFPPSLSLLLPLSLSLSITLSLFATETAVVILRGSCVNSVFSSAVNDNSALPVSSLSSSRHAFPGPLLPKLSAANPDQKVKKQVKRESLMLSNERERERDPCLCTCVNL